MTRAEQVRPAVEALRLLADHVADNDIEASVSRAADRLLAPTGADVRVSAC